MLLAPTCFPTSSRALQTLRCSGVRNQSSSPERRPVEAASENTWHNSTIVNTYLSRQSDDDALPPRPCGSYHPPARSRAQEPYLNMQVRLILRLMVRPKTCLQLVPWELFPAQSRVGGCSKHPDRSRKGSGRDRGHIGWPWRRPKQVYLRRPVRAVSVPAGSPQQGLSAYQV